MQRIQVPITGPGEGERISSGGNNHPALTLRNLRRPVLLPRPVANRPPPVSGGVEDHSWRLFEERVRTGPFSLTRFPAQPHSPIRILVLDDGLAHIVNPRLQQFIRDSPPRIRGQWHISSSSRGEQPGLSQEEVKKAMSKLKKQNFSPTSPRKKTGWKRGGLFCRSHGSKSIHEEEEDGDGKCSICLETFVGNEQVVVTPCNHIFHEECLVPWIKSHGQCPVCRHEFVERRQEPTADDGLMDIVALIRAMEEAFQWVNVPH